MESKFTISNSSEDEKDYIGNMIDAFNNKEAAFTQSPIFESINFIVKNDKDEENLRVKRCQNVSRKSCAYHLSDCESSFAK